MHTPEPQAYDLVIVVYLQVAAPMRSRVLRVAADAQLDVRSPNVDH